mgnify:CR=1 FL=1
MYEMRKWVYTIYMKSEQAVQRAHMTQYEEAELDGRYVRPGWMAEWRRQI